MLVQRIQILFDRVVDAEIDDLEAGALEHHRDEILADVVNVAFDGSDDNFADRLHTGFRQQRAQDFHSALHRVRGQQDLRNEQDAVAKIDADDAHAFHQSVVQHALCRPAPLQEDASGFFDFGLQSVVQVVMDLLDQFLVIEGA